MILAEWLVSFFSFRSDEIQSLSTDGCGCPLPVDRGFGGEMTLIKVYNQGDMFIHTDESVVERHEPPLRRWVRVIHISTDNRSDHSLSKCRSAIGHAGPDKENGRMRKGHTRKGRDIEEGC